MQQPNSSTFNFKKKHLAALRIIFAFIAFLLVFSALNEASKLLLVDDTMTPARAVLHSFYQQDTLDTLFLGSSHTMYGIDPAVFDETADSNSFNLGTNWQYLDVSYYLLNEAYQRYHINSVYLDCYYYLARGGQEPKTRDYDHLTSVFCCSDYIKNPLNRLGMITAACSPDYYIDALLPAKRYCSYIGDWEYMSELLKKKESADYRSGVYYAESNGEYVMTNGQMFSGNAINIDRLVYAKRENGIGSMESYAYWDQCLKRIITFCKDKGIKLTLFNTPMTDVFLIQAGAGHDLNGSSYDTYLSHLKELVEKTDPSVPLYDLNLCRKEYLDISLSDMRDPSHLNSFGAEKVSKVLAELNCGTISAEEAMFASYGEKLAEFGKIQGLLVESAQSGTALRIVVPIHVEPERITLVINGNPALSYDKDGIVFACKPNTAYTISVLVDDIEDTEYHYTTPA